MEAVVGFIRRVLWSLSRSMVMNDWLSPTLNWVWHQWTGYNYLIRRNFTTTFSLLNRRARVLSICQKSWEYLKWLVGVLELVFEELRLLVMKVSDLSVKRVLAQREPCLNPGHAYFVPPLVKSLPHCLLQKVQILKDYRHWAKWLHELRADRPGGIARDRKVFARVPK